mmetsp:Transcript_22430/g.64415  ORF Transcript_22430/g.64415 Transcript_22430/m.64415 type:complete len:209 (+) Transcript_22430:92-718(+)
MASGQKHFRDGAVPFMTAYKLNLLLLHRRHFLRHHLLPCLDLPLIGRLDDIRQLATSRQATDELHTKGQIVVLPTFVLHLPLGPLLLLSSQLGQDGGHLVGRIVQPGRPQMGQLGLQDGPTVVHHPHEVELDLGGGILVDPILNGGTGGRQPREGTGIVRVVVRSAAYRSGFESIELVHGAIGVGHIGNEMKDVVVLRGGPTGLVGIR